MRCKCIVLKSLYNTLDAIVRSKREPVVIIAITKGGWSLVCIIRCNDM